MCAVHKEWEWSTDYWAQNLSKVPQRDCHGTQHVAEALGKGDAAQQPTEVPAEPSVLTLSPGPSPRHVGATSPAWENPGLHAPPQKDWNILSKEMCVF